MTAKTLDKTVYNQIVKRLERGDSRRQVMEDLNLDERVVGKVSVHAGLSKSKPEVRKRDHEAVERWLAASKAAEKRPAASTAKKSTAKRAATRKKSA